MYFIFTLCMFIFNFLSFIEYSLSTSPACTYMYNRPFNLLPPTTTPPSQSRVICVYSELNEIIIIAEGGGREGGGAESMGCFYKPINTSFIRLSPMLSLSYLYHLNVIMLDDDDDTVAEFIAS